MEPLQLPASKDNPADRSADQTEVSPLSRTALATALAQGAFGRFYSPPIDADFIDKSPSELKAIRATMGVGAAG